MNPRERRPGKEENLMEVLLGFKLDLWDYLTFATLFLFVAVGLSLAVFILGLPGRIAIARKHPEAEAVQLMGYAGFLAVVPWMQAFIWAFKPTEVVDIRNFPRAEAREIDEQLARLTGKKPPETPAPPKG
jgi:Protein of unknown function (DUF3302)